MSNRTPPFLTPCPAELGHQPAHTWIRRQLLGHAVRLARGSYVLASDWESLPPWARQRLVVEAWHRLDPSSVVGAASSLALQGLPVLLEPGAVHLIQEGPEARHSKHRVVQGGRTIASYRVLRHRRPWAERTPVELGHWRVEEACEAAVFVASCPRTDLGAAVVAIDGAWKHAGGGDATRARLGELGEAFPQASARRRIAAALDLASPLAESAAESLARVAMSELGFAAPVEQLTIVLEGQEIRPDFTWPGLKLVLEVDGAVKYAGADEVAVRRQEKARQAMLVRAGYRVVRAEWLDVTRPERLRAILATLGVPAAA
ncbi:hypothetical protein [Galactobacter valiniphilus]|uniref:hypothetical protein n=1 Tax=Galactobacter valiniphilus TaxID=2676122 RepID=UPI003736B77F